MSAIINPELRRDILRTIRDLQRANPDAGLCWLINCGVSAHSTCDLHLIRAQIETMVFTLAGQFPTTSLAWLYPEPHTAAGRRLRRRAVSDACVIADRDYKRYKRYKRILSAIRKGPAVSATRRK